MILSNFRINETENQFEMEADGNTAFLEYYREGDKVYLNHTEVPHEMRGKGVAAHLVQDTLKYARQNGLTIVPSCSYVAYYVNNHPEWNDVLSEGYQM
jgi:predicted GNAT family acetyltransferase